MASGEKSNEHANQLASNGRVPGNDVGQSEQAQEASSIAQGGSKVRWQELFTVRHWLIWLIGAAGTWFLLDIAYYGTTVSTPFVIKLFSPKASLETTMLYTLVNFVFAALPGYIVAIFAVDHIGRKVMQLLGFAMMALSFGTLIFFPALTTITVSFILLYGASYFFTEFGPNVTPFLYPAEIFPETVRTTAHGFAASLGKVGAFIGAFIFPLMLASTAFKLPGAMGVAAGICAMGFLLTFLLPEPNQKSLEAIEKEGEQLDEHASMKQSAKVEAQ